MQDGDIFDKIKMELRSEGFQIADEDIERPWGGFFVVAESQALQFIETYFPTLGAADFAGFGKLSPKILLVKPGKRLSWQYHHRRSEIWRVLRGQVGVVKSANDDEGPIDTLQAGDIVRIAKGERHRLVGLNEWGVLAEVWQHTDPLHPSDESDIVRVADDYAR